MIEVYETPQEMETAAKAAGFSMKKVCEKAGIAPSTWYRWRKGITVPTHPVRVDLRYALEQMIEMGEELSQ